VAFELIPQKLGYGGAALGHSQRRPVLVPFALPRDRLERDLGYLVPRGYWLISVELSDLFPQTYHIECLAKLTRQDKSSF
jgi:tRNA/tmRNA/rRNA uracil-C5-methylase (TrmA/RlmC/RlmD family)